MKDVPRDTIIRASKGDIEAFEEIYRTASGYVHTVAFRVTGSREDAEEVAQDVFLSIYKNLWKFRFRSSFKTWMYRITANMAINTHKKRSKERVRETVFDEAVDTGHPPEIKTEEFDKEHSETLVTSMLDSLPPDQRACVVLKDIEGLRYREIAAALKININTVRSRLKRAREKLISRNRKRSGSHEVRKNTRVDPVRLH